MRQYIFISSAVFEFCDVLWSSSWLLSPSNATAAVAQNDREREKVYVWSRE